MALMDRLKQPAQALKADTLALYLAARHPATPWYVKLLVAAIVAYALSPIDLIPDFIPVIGYLDDLVLLPLGIALAIHLIPAAVMADCRQQARQQIQATQPSWIAATAIVLIWLILAVIGGAWIYRGLMA